MGLVPRCCCCRIYPTRIFRRSVRLKAFLFYTRVQLLRLVCGARVVFPSSAFACLPFGLAYRMLPRHQGVSLLFASVRGWSFSSGTSCVFSLRLIFQCTTAPVIHPPCLCLVGFAYDVMRFMLHAYVHASKGLFLFSRKTNKNQKTSGKSKKQKCEMEWKTVFFGKIYVGRRMWQCVCIDSNLSSRRMHTVHESWFFFCSSRCDCFLLRLPPRFTRIACGERNLKASEAAARFRWFFQPCDRTPLNPFLYKNSAVR